MNISAKTLRDANCFVEGITNKTMLDKIYIFIFNKYFYFHDPYSLVNFTSCMKICNEREMILPSANDNDIILEQFELKFGNETLEFLNGSNDSDLENKKTKDFLTYFIGELNFTIL